MNEKSRTSNVLLNVIFGYIAQIGILILSFVGRKIFLNFLSVDYLGINGLYTNILTILSLAELGLDTAFVFSLYKPASERNNKLLISLVNLFKKIYYILAIVIFIIGLLLIPLLKFLVSSDLSQKELIFYYVLFLINTVVSYFAAHKVALLSAFQEQRIQKIVALSTSFILQIIHIVILIFWKNYYIYLIGTIISTIISNIILSRICSKLHKDVFEEKETVDVDFKPIRERIFSTFLYRFGVVLINSTDNILISVIVSTVAVGFYSNYFIVINGIQGFIAIITASLIASIGNLAVKAKPKEQEKIFDMTLLFYHLISAIGLIGFSLLFNNLISVWLGVEYLFDEKTVFIIAFNFYLSNAITPVWMFREANGLFSKVKFILLIRAGINLCLSIVFGLLWGTFGIFIATAVSLLLTEFWYEPRILSKNIFNRSPSKYWTKQLKYFCLTGVAFILCFFSINHLSNSFIMLALKALIVISITAIIFLIGSFKTKEFHDCFSYLKNRKRK